MRKRITWIVGLVVLFLFLGGLSFAVEMYFDYLWFRELGKISIFTTALYAKSLIGCAAILISFLFLYISPCILIGNVSFTCDKIINFF